jgi:Na+-driven multidrug efflux pump
MAHGFLLIALPSHVLMALGMGFSGALRAVGDANRAMYVTLSGGLATAVIDPILIFTLGLGIDGAAICVVISRIVFMAVGWHGAVKVHAKVARPRLADALGDLKRVADIAVPAILTNIATPISLAFVARIVSDFGPWAVAANAVIDRLTPLAFGALFALSGAVGPILAQNWGAGMYHRMRQGLRDSFLFAGIYVLATWIVLVALRHQIVALFALSGPAAEGLLFFCWISGPMWFFIGLVFTANAAFNNLGFPFYATALNWGRGLIGTALAAWIGAAAGGYTGALAGMMIGQVAFGVAAAIAAVLCIRRLEKDARTAGRSGEAPPPDGARETPT